MTHFVDSVRSLQRKKPW